MTSAERPPTLAAALAELQTKLPEIRKSETARVESQKGSYSYTYANLAGISAQIMPLLGTVGLSFIAKPCITEHGFVLAYSLLHVSGEREDGEYPLPSNVTPQQIGSAITYGRRYCLCSVTGVAPEDDDDDGAAAGQPRKRAAKKQVERTTRAEAGQWASDQETGELITAPQLKLLAILAKELGYDKDRDDYLARLSDRAGRKIDSSKSLMQTEAHRVIDAWKAERDAAVDAFPDDTKEPQP